MGECERMVNNSKIKGKEIAVTTRVENNQSDAGEDEDKATRSMPCAKFSPRNASSKYDFVKVKVWLGDNADHCYVLSRFLLSRMLTVTKIPNHVAVKIALELKKLLIDNSLLDISQSDLEANLFKLMERRGYGEEFVNRYKMMTRFHHQRVPLVILVCGTACVGKSTIATQIAQRLNLPNVLQTDMVYELLRTSTDAPLASTPVWAQEFSSSEELITEFCRECRIVRKGLNGDLKKAMKDGKPIIIEGIHLDPSIYLMNDELTAPTSVQGPSQSMAPDDNSAVQMEVNSVTSRSSTVNGQNHPVDLAEGVSADKVNKVSESVTSPNLATASHDKAETVKAPEVHAAETIKAPEANGSTARKENSGPKPIIIPIVLKMSEFDHKALLEERVATQTVGVQDTDSLIRNLKIIQNYLCSFKSQGLTVVNVSATTFTQTLDWLHGYLLQSWDEGMRYYGR